MRKWLKYLWKRRVKILECVLNYEKWSNTTAFSPGCTRPKISCYPIILLGWQRHCKERSLAEKDNTPAPLNPETTAPPTCDRLILKTTFHSERINSYQFEKALGSIFIGFWNYWEKSHDFCKNVQSYVCFRIWKRQFSLIPQDIDRAVDLVISLEIKP